MNHSVVSTSACKNCHNGSYLTAGSQGALAKPGNHIPETQLLNGAAMDCDDCHTGTTVWTSVRMNHNASQGNGSGWCKGCHVSGTSFLGGMDKKSLAHKAKAGVVPTDCSQSGCHRPLGTKGQAYSAWD
jgi:nitrate/TMAO reductase-like tetraheme cytochrome c subunit